MSEWKVCVDCGVSKRVVDFWLCSKAIDGRGDRCKACIRLIENIPGIRVCRSCLEIKLAECFSDAARYRNGKNSRCKRCRHEDSNRNRRTGGARREQYLKGKREGRRLRKYLLRVGRFEEMVNEQNGRCGLCGEPFDETKAGLSARVDHCHRTGRVRTLLHANCNVLIGMAGESVDRLQKAIDYLVEHSTQACVVGDE